MLVDKTTLEDLSIFMAVENQSVLSWLDHCQTTDGRYWLQQLLANPFNSIEQIQQTQKALQCIICKHAEWPKIISNGTLMVLDKYYESQIDALPTRANLANTLSYKLLHPVDYSLVTYTAKHIADFYKGIAQLVQVMAQENLPPVLSLILCRMLTLLNNDTIQRLLKEPSSEKIPATRKLQYGALVLYRYKDATKELMSLFARLDAYYALATASIQYNLVFPEFVESNEALIEARGLYHVLLRKPVPYNLTMNPHTNFIFLTGANMAGKSTFIKTVGLAVYLAHIGMAVPAQHMRLSLFNGLLSNIHVVDNITKGESYFFNEVQRIKNTIIKVSDEKKWLVLIDELFKGTNMQDAVRCSTAVISGLLKVKNSLFILSTHLYEIGEGFNQNPNIAFRYFETGVENDQLSFSYQLKNGISNDRLGYMILRQEGVVELLDKL